MLLFGTVTHVIRTLVAKRAFVADLFGVFLNLIGTVAYCIRTVAGGFHVRFALMYIVTVTHCIRTVPTIRGLSTWV